MEQTKCERCGEVDGRAKCKIYDAQLERNITVCYPCRKHGELPAQETDRVLLENSEPNVAVQSNMEVSTRTSYEGSGKCSVCGAFFANPTFDNGHRDENGHKICDRCNSKLRDAALSAEARQALRMSCPAFAMCTECTKPTYNSPYNNTHGQKVCRECADKTQ